jgi:hypothetical protein
MTPGYFKNSSEVETIKLPKKMTVGDVKKLYDSLKPGWSDGYNLFKKNCQAYASAIKKRLEEGNY